LAKFRRKGREVELEAEQRIVNENSTYMALDIKGREVKVEELSTAPAEEEYEKVLAESGEKLRKLEISSERVIDIVRSKIAKRPADAERITNEIFEISEYTLVYIPVYEATYKNIKTNETQILKIDGVTSKIIKT